MAHPLHLETLMNVTIETVPIPPFKLLNCKD